MKKKSLYIIFLFLSAGILACGSKLVTEDKTANLPGVKKLAAKGANIEKSRQIPGAGLHSSFPIAADKRSKKPRLSNLKKTKKKLKAALLSAAKSGRADRIKTLLDYGADPNVKDGYGNTALILAIGYNADVSSFDSFFISERNRTRVVGTLLFKGADPNIKNRLGETALILAANYHFDGIVRMLLDAGAKIKRK